MKTSLFTALVGVLLLVAYFLPGGENSSRLSETIGNSKQASMGVLGAPAPRKVTPIVGNPTLGSTPEEVAERYIDLHRQEWGLKDYHKLHPTVFRTPLGTRINYAVYQDQVPIIELGIRIQVDRALKISKVENDYRPLERVSIPKDLTASRVVENHLATRYQVDAEAGMSEAPVLVPVKGSDKPVVAFVIPARERTSRRRPVQLLLRADDGQVLRRSVSRVEFH